MTLWKRVLQAGAALGLAAVASSAAYAQDEEEGFQDPPRQERQESQEYFLNGSWMTRGEYTAQLLQHVRKQLKIEHNYDEEGPTLASLEDDAKKLREEKQTIRLPLLLSQPVTVAVPAYSSKLLDETFVDVAKGFVSDSSPQPRMSYAILKGAGHPAPEKVIDEALQAQLNGPAQVSPWSSPAIVEYWKLDKGGGDITKGCRVEDIIKLAHRAVDLGYSSVALDLFRDVKAGFHPPDETYHAEIAEVGRKITLRSAPVQANYFLAELGHPDPTRVVDTALDELFKDPTNINPQYAHIITEYWRVTKGNGDITKGTSAERMIAIANQCMKGYPNTAYYTYLELKNSFKVDPAELRQPLREYGVKLAKDQELTGAWNVLTNIGDPAPEKTIDAINEWLFRNPTFINTYQLHQFFTYWRRHPGGVTKAATVAQVAFLTELCADSQHNNYELAADGYRMLKEDFKVDPACSAWIGARSGKEHLPPSLLVFLDKETLAHAKQPTLEKRLLSAAETAAKDGEPTRAYNILMKMGYATPEQFVDAIVDDIISKPARLRHWDSTRIAQYWKFTKGKGDITKGTTADKLFTLIQNCVQFKAAPQLAEFCKALREQFAVPANDKRWAPLFAEYLATAVKSVPGYSTPQQTLNQFQHTLYAYSNAEGFFRICDIDLPSEHVQEELLQAAIQKLKEYNYQPPEAEQEELEGALSGRYDFFLIKPFLDNARAPAKPEWLVKYAQKSFDRKHPDYANGLAALAHLYRTTKDATLLPDKTGDWAFTAFTDDKKMSANLNDALTLLAATKHYPPPDAQLEKVATDRLEHGDFENALRAASAITSDRKYALVRDTYTAWSGLADNDQRMEQARYGLPALATGDPEALITFAHLAMDHGHGEVASAAYRLAARAFPDDGKKRKYLIGMQESAEMTRREYCTSYANLSERRKWNENGPEPQTQFWKDVSRQYNAICR